VRVDGANFSGPVHLKFAIIADAAPETNLWANDGTAAGEPARATAATAVEGACRLQLGDTTLAHMQALPPEVFASAAPLMLRVWLQAGTGPLEQLDPDTPLLPAPFAFNSALLDGYAPQAFASTAATCQLVADLAAVAAVFPILSNDVLAVQAALAAEITNRVQAGAALAAQLETAQQAHSVTVEFALAGFVLQLNAVADQFAVAHTALATNLLAEAAQRAAADSNLAADILAASSTTVAALTHLRADLTAYTDAATNATLGQALGAAYDAAATLTDRASASNQSWALSTFLNKQGDRMAGPLRVGHIFMLSTNIAGYIATGIAAPPEADGFYCANGQTNNAAPVFGNAAGVLLYRYLADADGFYEWRIGPNLSGTPCYAAQQYAQEPQPPVTQWSGATLAAAVLTNTALIDFAGGAARNLAPATDARDAVILGQLTDARREVTDQLGAAMTTVAADMAGLALDLASATNAVTSQLQHLFVTRTAPGAIIITNAMTQAAARATLSVGQSFVPACAGALRTARCWPAAPAAVLHATLYAGVMWNAVQVAGASSTRTTGPDGATQFDFAPGAATVSSGQTYTIVLSLAAPVAFNECPGSTYPRGELCYMNMLDGGMWLPDVAQDLGLLLAFDPVERTRIDAAGIALANGATISLDGQTLDDRFLNAAGDSLRGDLNANGRRITNLPAPAGAGDAVSKGGLDTATAAVRNAISNELATTYATRTEVATYQFGANNLASNAVTAGKLAAGAVTGAALAAGAVSTAGLANNAVTSAKLAADVDARYVNATGDTISGNLALQGALLDLSNADRTQAAGKVILVDAAQARAKNVELTLETSAAAGDNTGYSIVRLYPHGSADSSRNYIDASGVQIKNVAAPAAARDAATKSYADALAAAVSDAGVKKAGDAMTGLLTLGGEPTQALHAATMHYVDAAFTGFDYQARYVYIDKYYAGGNGGLGTARAPFTNFFQALAQLGSHAFYGHTQPVVYHVGHGAYAYPSYRDPNDPNVNLRVGIVGRGMYFRNNHADLHGNTTVFRELGTYIDRIQHAWPAGCNTANAILYLKDLVVSGVYLASTACDEIYCDNVTFLSVTNNGQQQYHGVYYTGCMNGGEAGTLTALDPQSVRPGYPAGNDAAYVKQAGDTMTGPLTLAGPPTSANHAATKGYIDTRQIGAANLANGAVTAAALNQMGASAGQVLAWNGTGWAPASNLGGPLNPDDFVRKIGDTMTGALTLSGAGDWQVGAAQARADIVLQHPAAQIRSTSGDLTFSAPAQQAIRLQSFTQLSAEQFGRATIPVGERDVQVSDKPVTAASVILLTPCAAVPGAPYAQVDGATFWIKLPAPATQDTPVNFVILNR